MKGIIQSTKRYYKNTEIDWTQPTLTSNGTMGGDQFAVTAIFGGNNSQSNVSDSYSAFSPNEGWIGFYCDEWWSWMKMCFYFPTPTRITSLYFYIPYIGSASGGAYNTALYAGTFAGDTSITYYNIGGIGENSACSLTFGDELGLGYYQYYNIYCSNGGHSYEDMLHIGRISITGKQKSITEATEDDYDYYTEAKKILIPKLHDTFYGYNKVS